MKKQLLLRWGKNRGVITFQSYAQTTSIQLFALWAFCCSCVSLALPQYLVLKHCLSHCPITHLWHKPFLGKSGNVALHAFTASFCPTRSQITSRTVTASAQGSLLQTEKHTTTFGVKLNMINQLRVDSRRALYVVL